MSLKENKLIVPEAEALMSTYKEEYAHEFGILHSVQESDAKAINMTKNLLQKTKKDQKSEKNE